MSQVPATALPLSTREDDSAVPWFGPWGIKLVNKGAWGAQITPEARPLLSSAETWSSQLIECVLPSGTEEEGAAGSWRGVILWKSLLVMILGAVGVLGPGLTFFSSLSFEEEGSGDAFLESSAAETLLEERLPVQQAWERPLEWMCLPALELAQEIRLSESGDSPTLVGVA